MHFGIGNPSLAGVLPSARLEDAVVLYSTSIVLAYDEGAFPKNWADFWHVKRFPGPRGLGTLHSWRTISCALAAAGIPPDIFGRSPHCLTLIYRMLSRCLA